MAKILYGVQGDALGHINRGRIISQYLSENEFLFVGGKKTHELMSDGFSVLDVPVLTTFYKNSRVDDYRTIKNGLHVLAQREKVVKKVSHIIRDFDPDLVLTDYEYFTALACRRLGRPCISLDHQHILTHCEGSMPDRRYPTGLITKSLVKGLFSGSSHFLIVSFFRLPPKDGLNTEVFSAIVRDAVLRQTPMSGNHALVYVTTDTFHQIIPLLGKMDGNFIIYGFGPRPPYKNLIFKGHSKEGFIEDLTSSRYVINNGGHNTISEALCLEKPVFAFPIPNNFEQVVNGYYLKELGYGDYVTDLRFARTGLERFEKQLAHYRRNIREGFVTGNREIIDRLKTLIDR